jgi:plastocyanin
VFPYALLTSVVSLAGIAACGAGVLGLSACSSSSSGSSSAADAGGNTVGDAGNTGDAVVPDDASTVGDGATFLNGCTTFADHTSAGDPRAITWDLTIGSNPDRCMTIRKGQTVTFNGDFVFHPIGTSGGDTPNPIALPDGGTSDPITFPNAGDYGFVCNVHASMNGVIRVLP